MSKVRNTDENITSRIVGLRSHLWLTCERTLQSVNENFTSRRTRAVSIVLVVCPTHCGRWPDTVSLHSWDDQRQYVQRHTTVQRSHINRRVMTMSFHKSTIAAVEEMYACLLIHVGTAAACTLFSFSRYSIGRPTLYKW